VNAISGLKELRDEVWDVAAGRGFRVLMRNPLLSQIAASAREERDAAWYDGLRERWRPGYVTTLFIGKSPARSSQAEHFFYSEPLTPHDYLYRAVVTAVLNKEPGRAGVEKREHLCALRDRGVFVIDFSSVPEPESGAVDDSYRAELHTEINGPWPDEGQVNGLHARIRSLNPDRVVVYQRDVYEVLTVSDLPAEILSVPPPTGRGRARFIGAVRRSLGSPVPSDPEEMFGLTSRFDQAQNFAARLHRFQTRKGSHVPYLGHLLGVASIVIDAGGTEDQAIAALLHDAIEDAGGEETRLEIEGRFGSNVANIVVACSDTAQHPKPPWRERKEQYLEHLEIVSEQVLLVSLADKLYNVRSMLLDYAAVGEALWDRFRVGRDRQLWYYRSLGEVFSRRFPGPLSAELVSLVKRLEQAA
jgi:hypothetical protein